MWDDVLTKPKKGRSFLKVRLVPMNCHLNYKDDAILDDVEISGGSAKPDVYVWTKKGRLRELPEAKVMYDEVASTVEAAFTAGVCWRNT